MLLFMSLELTKQYQYATNDRCSKIFGKRHTIVKANRRYSCRPIPNGKYISFGYCCLFFRAVGFFFSLFFIFIFISIFVFVSGSSRCLFITFVVSSRLIFFLSRLFLLLSHCISCAVIFWCADDWTACNFLSCLQIFYRQFEFKLKIGIDFERPHTFEINNGAAYQQNQILSMFFILLMVSGG